MTAIPAAEYAGDLDVLHRIVIVVAEREGNQCFRPQPAAAPGLRRNLQAIDRGSFDRGRQWICLDARRSGGGSCVRYGGGGRGGDRLSLHGWRWAGPPTGEPRDRHEWQQPNELRRKLAAAQRGHAAKQGPCFPPHLQALRWRLGQICRAARKSATAL